MSRPYRSTIDVHCLLFPDGMVAEVGKARDCAIQAGQTSGKTKRGTRREQGQRVCSLRAFDRAKDVTDRRLSDYCQLTSQFLAVQ